MDKAISSTLKPKIESLITDAVKDTPGATVTDATKNTPLGLEISRKVTEAAAAKYAETGDREWIKAGQALTNRKSVKPAPAGFDAK